LQHVDDGGRIAAWGGTIFNEAVLDFGVRTERKNGHTEEFLCPYNDGNG